MRTAGIRPDGLVEGARRKTLHWAPQLLGRLASAVLANALAVWTVGCRHRNKFATPWEDATLHRHAKSTFPGIFVPPVVLLIVVVFLILAVLLIVVVLPIVVVLLVPITAEIDAGAVVLVCGDAIDLLLNLLEVVSVESSMPATRAASPVLLQRPLHLVNVEIDGSNPSQSLPLSCNLPSSRGMHGPLFVSAGLASRRTRSSDMLELSLAAAAHPHAVNRMV